MTLPETLEPRALRWRRPGRGDAIRHVVDAVAAPLSFLVLDSQWGARWAAVSALALACVIATLRRHRGESQVVVAVSTTIVALASASAVVMGQGRAFYLPELLINAVGLVVCVGSLLGNRPITGVVCRKAGLESQDLDRDPRSVRRHRLLTAAWVGLWVAHLIPLVVLYALDSLVGLTLLATVVDKPTMFAMAVITVVVTRRSGGRGAAHVAVGASAA